MAELLEVYDAAGESTGVVKSRSAIHLEGDWHIAAFIWLFDAHGRVLLQRRSLQKDVWPGSWDASAAGHVEAGESVEDAARRELIEELGLHVSPEDLLRDPSMHVTQEHRHPNGLVDREHHAVFFVRADLPLERYEPGPEVTEIALVSAADLAAFARGERDDLRVLAHRVVLADPELTAPMTLRRDHIVVYDSRYLEHVAARVLTSSAERLGMNEP